MGRGAAQQPARRPEDYQWQIAGVNAIMLRFASAEPLSSTDGSVTFILAKYAVTALVIVLVSEVAKRSDRLGALIGALPLVTVMVMIWLYVERQGTEKIANHAYYTFWYVLPTLPMFVLMPYLLYRGAHFWMALAAGVLVTIAAFVLTAVIARRFGVELLP